VLSRLLLAGRAYTWVCRVERLRRQLPFDGLVETLESWPQPDHPRVSPQLALRAVRRVYRFTPFEPSCLKLSLAGVGLLRSLGHSARLAIGVKPEGGPLQAHAWVELDGRMLGEEDTGYARMRRPAT
jgi:hypothetical protein